MTGPRAWLLLAALRVVAVAERDHGRRTRAWNTGHHSAVTTRRTPRQASRERFSRPNDSPGHSETPDSLTGRQAATQRWRNG